MTFLDRLLGRTGAHVLEQQELVKRAISLLEAGTPSDEVENELVHHGISRRQARRTIRHILEVRKQGLHLFERP